MVKGAGETTITGWVLQATVPHERATQRLTFKVQACEEVNDGLWSVELPGPAKLQFHEEALVEVSVNGVGCPRQTLGAVKLGLATSDPQRRQKLSYSTSSVCNDVPQSTGNLTAVTFLTRESQLAVE